jgi:predicted acetyltransferase
MTIGKPGEIEVLAAGAADRSLFKNLIQLYLYDMASETRFALGEDGIHDCGLLDQFWDRPYLVRVAGEIAGFAPVISACPVTGASDCWFMAEFFVLRPYRRMAVGRALFTATLSRHPGQWHVASQVRNTAAGAFWARVIDRACSDAVSVSLDDADWVVRTFVAENGAATQPKAR